MTRLKLADLADEKPVRVTVELSARRALRTVALRRERSALLGEVLSVLSFAVDLIAMIFGMPRALFPEIASFLIFGVMSPFAAKFMPEILAAAMPEGMTLTLPATGWHGWVIRTACR